ARHRRAARHLYRLERIQVAVSQGRAGRSRWQLPRLSGRQDRPALQEPRRLCGQGAGERRSVDDGTLPPEGGRRPLPRKGARRKAREPVMAKLDRNGVKIHYEVHGKGPAILLSHGYSSTSRMWDDQVAALKDRYQVIVWDFRGHGETDYPTDQSRYSEAL